MKDTGIGIAGRCFPAVFDLFVQGERSLDRTEGGLGLGLTIVKRLVALHGGTVVAKSEGVDKGSEFIVRLPALAQKLAATARPRRGSRRNRTRSAASWWSTTIAIRRTCWQRCSRRGVTRFE